MLKTLSNLKYTLTSPFLDIGKLENSILLIGMGRSGTTWAANIINHDHSYRVLFEPLFPALVREAKDFEYIQYIPVYDSNPRLRKKAASILAGKPRNRWVDRDNSGLLYRRRIIKDIRCNLMAGWLKKMFPHLPIVLLIRHPLQVAASWRKLGWGKEALGQRSDFDIITSQHRLIQDFPLLQSIVEQIDPNNFLDNVIFLWGVYHLIPFQQLHPDEVYYLYYEKLLTQPENECKKLFKYLNKPFSWKLVQNTLIHESSTNFQKRDFSKEHDQLLNGWKNIFSEGEIQRAKEILTMFGLDSIFQ
ncbi:MAG: sulfotransferase [Bacteroidetes bacterium]|nr:sulfotransferase [Bacteroidota bacterium]